MASAGDLSFAPRVSCPGSIFPMNNEHEIRRDAIIASATEQIRGLLETHFRDINKAAEQSFQGDENQEEPTAKVSVSVEWPVLAQAAKVLVKVGWSVRFKDESEEEVDPLQSKLGLEGKQ